MAGRPFCWEWRPAIFLCVPFLGVLFDAADNLAKGVRQAETAGWRAFLIWKRPCFLEFGTKQTFDLHKVVQQSDIHITEKAYRIFWAFFNALIY